MDIKENTLMVYVEIRLLDHRQCRIVGYFQGFNALL